jgi:ABC-type multidrug transport system fused ATPase/permease subunit
MQKLAEIALSVEKRKYVVALGLQDWLMDGIDQACSSIPGHHSYQRPTSSPLYFIDVFREWLDGAIYICAACLAYRRSVSLGTVLVMKSASAEIGSSLLNLYRTIDGASSEFRSARSYRKCLLLARNTQASDDFIPYCNGKNKGMAIEAHDVCFSYEYLGNRTPVLHNISFSLTAGETVAIVGFNGYFYRGLLKTLTSSAGKSTLISLLSLLCTPTSGTLKINGNLVAAYNPKELREQIAVQFQEKCNLDLGNRSFDSLFQGVSDSRIRRNW